MPFTIIEVKRMGELTTLSIATSGKGSLRTTVPMSILKHFKLKPGDKLDWDFEARNNELVIIVRPCIFPVETPRRPGKI
jgi:hypothetical protein